MNALLIWLAGLFVVVGSLFTLTAAIGLVRLPDLYTRMHAASKAGTLGSCLMLLALACGAAELSSAMRSLAGVVFFLLTAPISAHLLAKAAYAAGYPLWQNSVLDEMNLPGANAEQVKSFEMQTRSSSVTPRAAPS